MEHQSSLMRKGFEELKEMENRKHRRRSLWNPPSSTRGSPSTASQAVKQFYEKQAEVRSNESLAQGYVPELDELQKCFLARPGCPKYSHRATSTSHLEASFARIPQLPHNVSTISLSSQVPMDELNALLQNPEVLELQSSVRYYPASISQSVPGFLQSYSEEIWPSGEMKNHTGNKIPWYVSVLQEKDMLLQRLGGEVSRLSRCENECVRKDDVITILREEVQSMQKQLDNLEREAVDTPKQEEEPPKEPKGTGVKLHQRGFSLPAFFTQKTIPKELREEMARLKEELSHSDKVLDTKMVQLSQTLMKDQEELEELEKEYMEMQQKGMLRIGEEEEYKCDSKELIIGDLGLEEAQAKEKSIHSMLCEFQRMNQELYEELEKVKEDYDIATGAISSLQRQLSFEASQLRNAHSEQDLLQKELRERGNQLEAMSTKFSNLREARKHEEMMGAIERENHKLRQDVSDLELRLSEKSQMIEDLQTQVNQLQAELAVNQHHVGKQLTQQSELQRQLDTLQRAEQLTRVTLEIIGARFERFRSKIIQATYSSPGTKSPQAEIGDEEVLEALQKIITDRVDFHQLLKQKGVKVPPLNSCEPGLTTSSQGAPQA
ncbi:coiled-coil domain-containing protein 27 [Tiliqua scincoides]|uniref:coiled-coil domain-containing protein 27 n=1 Tax=Tiliqua scincoides TaxID=71010 RepID=UPI003461F14F